MDLFSQIPLNFDQFPRTFEIVQSAVEQQVAPGFVIGVWQKKDPDLFYLGAFGQRRWVPSSLPLSVDTVFDLASLTKVVATAPLAAVLVERGWLSWDTPVVSILPEFGSAEVEVRHLLSHSAGFVAWKPFWQTLRDQLAPGGRASELEKVDLRVRQALMRKLILSEIPGEKPGTRALYSDVSFLLLGFLLEELLGRPLHDAALRDLWRPLGLMGFQFRPGHQPSEAIAATEQCPWRERVLQGEVHDDNCWAMGGVAGHAGVFGTAEDLLKYIRCLVLGRFLSPRVLSAMWTPVATPQGCGRTLGWDTPSQENSSAGRFFSRNSVGHLGFSGTSVWYDLDAELAVVLLSNRIHPSRENGKMKSFRPVFHDAVRTDLLSI